MKEYLTSDHLANTVRMARSIDNRAVMFVEGATDARFFERFVDLDGCKVVAAHDRKRALGALRLLNSSAFSGVLAVVDADFVRITSTFESDRNLFYSDGHDLEVMLLRSQALDIVVREHASEEKLSAFIASQHSNVLASILIQSVAPVGALVLISLEQDLGFTFDGVNFRDFVKAHSLQVEVPALIRCVMHKSSRHDTELAKQLEQRIGEVLTVISDFAELARGHDCVELLAFALRTTIGTKKSATDTRKPQTVTAELLERELRLAFAASDFFATGLYESLLNWQSEHSEYSITLQS